jgi:hypothetical protein
VAGELRGDVYDLLGAVGNLSVADRDDGAARRAPLARAALQPQWRAARAGDAPATRDRESSDRARSSARASAATGAGVRATVVP